MIDIPLWVGAGSLLPPVVYRGQIEFFACAALGAQK